MLMLGIAALLWVGIHLGIAGTRLRDAIVARIGEVPFRGLFSLLSIAAIVFLVHAWRTAETEPLWTALPWLRMTLAIVMLPVFMLFVASVTLPNPTMVGPPGIESRPALGIQRITRHPMLWSFALWAIVHMLGNGDTAALLFFGAFLITALAGMPSIDAKLQRRNPASWARLARATSAMPFLAIAQGRNELRLREIGWVPPLLGTIAWGVVLALHPWLFGVPVIVH